MTTTDPPPLLAPWYRIVGDGDRLLLEYAQTLVVLEGAAVRTLLPALLPLLDGKHTVEELSSRLGPASRPAIEAALSLLREHGLVVDGPDAAPELRAAVRSAAATYGLAPAVAAERLGAAAVTVIGSGAARIELVRLLTAAGIRGLRRRSWNSRTSSDLAILVPAGDELDRLQAWNRGALSTDAPFLVVRPWDGKMAAVGPLVLPRKTCCYECVLLRRAANSAYEADLAELEATPSAVEPDAPLTAFAAALAAHLAVRWLVGEDASVPGVMHVIEPRPAVRLREHTVLRVPRCPACSIAARQSPPLPWHSAVAA